MIYNSVFFYLSYKMNSAVWILYCDVIEKSHENFIQYSNYHAKNSQISHSFFFSIFIWREIIDFSIDSFSSYTQVAVSVSAAFKFTD